MGPIKANRYTVLLLLVSQSRAAFQPKTCSQLGWAASSSNNAGVCGSNEVGLPTSSCNKRIGFSAAKELCASVGARMCTATEIAKDRVTVGSGCSLAKKYAWTSDSCGGTDSNQMVARAKGKTATLCKPTAYGHLAAGVCCADTSKATGQQMATPTKCNAEEWTATKKVCGSCKALVRFSGHGDLTEHTCDAHCKAQGGNMACTGAWENKKAGSCKVRNNLKCDTIIGAGMKNDAVCQCGPSTVQTPAAPPSQSEVATVSNPEAAVTAPTPAPTLAPTPAPAPAGVTLSAQPPAKPTVGSGQCDSKTWASTKRTCGKCKALIDFSTHTSDESTCNAYCESQGGLICTNAQENKGITCKAKTAQLTCETKISSAFNKDAVCTCVAAHSASHEVPTETVYPTPLHDPSFSPDREAFCGAAAVGSKPHIVYVLADDLGFNDVGYNHNARKGKVVPITPNLDKLAHSGVILDRIYTYTRCAPSRASLLTGRYPMHVSQRNPSVSMRGGGVPLEMTTIAEKLKGKGYTSYLIGKWHAGSDLRSRIPVARGFSHSFGMLGGMSDYFSQVKTLSSGFSAVDCWRDDGPAYGENAKKYATHLYTDEAVAAISAQPSHDPLFILLSHQAPHTPLQAPQKYVDMYTGKPGHASTPNHRKIYLGMITAMDEGVGTVVEKLTQRGFWEKTLFVFTSDNGGDMRKRIGGSDNYPLRDQKGSMYEGGVRTAGFVAGGIVPTCAQGRRLNGMVHLADFMATFGALAGYTTEDERAEKAGLPPSDSQDFWPYLTGATNESPRQEVSIEGGTGGYTGTLIMKIGGALYKYIHSSGEVYDLSDGFESENLKDQHSLQPVLNRLRDRVKALDKTAYQSFPDHTGHKPDPGSKSAVKTKYGGHWGPWVG